MVKRSTPVTRDELRRLRARLEKVERDILEWQIQQRDKLSEHDGSLGSVEGRLERVEGQLAAILRAAEANPQALHEVVLAVLQGKEPPR